MTTVETGQQQIQQPLEELKGKVETIAGPIEFPIAKTLIAQDVWYKEGEDLDKVCSTIINKALDLPMVKIIRCERKNGWEKGSGLVKIELENSSDIKTVLKKKSELKEISSSRN